jgi:periplasmic protein TonB
MKKMLTAVVAVVTVMHTAAQETVERTVDDFSRPGTKEIFTVLKSKKRIKQGPYRRINAQGKVLASGFFKENIKDSIWEEYNWNGTRLLSRGQYVNDKKTGVWEYYGYEGEEMHSYDHTTNQLVNFKVNPGDSLYLVYEGSEIKMMRLDQPPILIGGKSVMQNTLLRNLRYPTEAIRSQKTGTVVIAFDVEVDGSITNYHVKNKVDPALDNEALRVVKLIPRQWVPGVKDGQKVKVQIKQPVLFRL